MEMKDRASPANRRTFIVSRTCCRLFGVVATLFLAASAVAQEPPRNTPAAPAFLPASRDLVPDDKPQQPLPLDLPDAQARAAAARKVAELAKLNAAAARYHRQAIQADYFPKIGANFANLHFNKFLGQEIVLARRTAALPLLNKDESLFRRHRRAAGHSSI
jgi:hypothetical protein